MQLASSM